MQHITSMYDLSIDQIVDAISANKKRTMFVQGDMGCGKSSILHVLAKRYPTHTPCYFDCTVKDLGDISIPNIANLDSGAEFVQFVPNEEFGVHLNKPLILMIDEMGKANPSVQNALALPIYEHRIGTRKFPQGSMVFCTTNLGAEGVGDVVRPHHANRMTMVRMRKPSWNEWLEWGVENGIHETVLAWVNDAKQTLFQSFTEVENPDDNEYIFHPKSQRTSFVTPRSLEAASDWMHVSSQVDSNTLTASLMGTIGHRGGLDLINFVELVSQMPSWEDITTRPEQAMVPTNNAIHAMVVFRALANVQRDQVTNWVTYMKRLPKEAQGMFANGCRSDKYSKAAFIFQNKTFVDWARNNGYMFSADKR